jgi:hypothetical protein
MVIAEACWTEHLCVLEVMRNVGGKLRQALWMIALIALTAAHSVG